MVKLSWGAAGERFYEAGVDRGVLYVDSEMGVPWNGLTSVNEKAVGGEPKPYYADGIKYLNVSASEEFEASISAFSSPPEFDQCDGVSQIANGLFIGQQPRRPFHFSYRTRIGNELDSLDRHYKLHVVYNALSTPSEKKYDTLKDSPSALTLNWDITTTPPYSTAHKPTAHFTIDSRKTPKKLMGAIEDILYGSETALPRIPDSEELVELFTSPGPVVKTNYFSDNPGVRSYKPYPNLPAWRSTGVGQLSAVTSPYAASGRAVRYTVTSPPENPAVSPNLGVAPFLVNQTMLLNPTKVWTFCMGVLVGQDSVLPVNWVWTSGEAQTASGSIIDQANVTELKRDIAYKIWFTMRVDKTLSLSEQLRYSYRPGNVTVNTIEFFDLDLYPGLFDPNREWFDGDTPNTNEITHYWDGEPLKSPSYARSWGSI